MIGKQIYWRFIQSISIMLMMLTIFILSNCYTFAEDKKELSNGRATNKKNNRTEIEADGYKYIYEGAWTSDEIVEENILHVKITIIDKRILNQSKIILEETMDEIEPILDPIFLKLPNISRLPDILGVPTSKWFVVHVADIGGEGKGVMARVYFDSENSLMSTTLWFGRSKFNLNDLDNDGFYESKVSTEIQNQFPDFSFWKGGYSYYFIIYRLTVDANTIGFFPVFDNRVSKFYLQDYQDRKDRILDLKHQDVIDEKSAFDEKNAEFCPMLADLLASGDLVMIKNEWKFLKNEFEIQSNEEIISWAKRINKLGYPEYNYQQIIAR